MTHNKKLKKVYEYRKEKDLSMVAINKLGKSGWRIKHFGESMGTMWYFFEIEVVISYLLPNGRRK